MGKVEKKPDRKDWLKNQWKWTGYSAEELFHSATNRKEFKIIAKNAIGCPVANI